MTKQPPAGKQLRNSININVFKNKLSPGGNVFAQLLFVRSYHYYIQRLILRLNLKINIQ
jgi:hypothetical protein